MSEAMIVRRGGGSKGGGFDPTGAVLKVVTSAGCIVDISATGYTATQIDSDGYPRIGNPDVVEHFFNIPATAFGTVTVMATNDYGMNTKTLTVNTAGKVYEQLCGGINIILDPTFGLQDGYTVASNVWEYSERYKYLHNTGSDVSNYKTLFQNIPVEQYEQIKVTGQAYSAGSNNFDVRDQDGVYLCRLTGFTSQQGQYSTVTGILTDKYYPTAYFTVRLIYITEIVLS